MARPIWFEKTVEYKYVYEKLGPERIYPLSGKLEKWLGDAILAGEGRFKIIEFKRHSATLSSENKKYNDSGIAGFHYTNLLETAREAIGAVGNTTIGHYFIYGEAKDNAADSEDEGNSIADKSGIELFSDISLWQCNYWQWDTEEACDPHTMVCFTDAAAFSRYLEFLFSTRNDGQGSSSGNATVEIRIKEHMLLMALREYLIFWEKIYKEQYVNRHSSGENLGRLPQPSDEECEELGIRDNESSKNGMWPGA